MKPEELLEKVLQLPSSTLSYTFSQQLLHLFPEKALVETEEGFFDLETYALEGQCSIRPKPGIFSQFYTAWEAADDEELEEDRLTLQARNAWLEVEWQDHTLEVIRLEWDGSSCRNSLFWLLADTEALANEFLSAVCSWNAETRGEVLVFVEGSWQKDKKLFDSIQKSTLDNLIMEDETKERLSEDLRSFFSSRELYRSYNLDWKRGVLFIGPPGNGKTHAVKALVNLLQKPCLYVKSFRSQYETDEGNIRDIFAKARKTAPCILVLEDLDSLLDDENRAFFLNELDGFAANEGILTLATTNHPEKLDPAVVNRPSRFDRKYHFNLPTYVERLNYIRHWNSLQQETTHITEEASEAIAAATGDFSFAYLKELFVSALIRWLGHPQTDIMDKLLFEEMEQLREQMKTENTTKPSAGEQK